jgi:hypothetical protein
MVKKNIPYNKTGNKKIGIILLFSVLILVLACSFAFSSNISVPTSDTTLLDHLLSSSLSEQTILLPTDAVLELYITPNDYERFQQEYDIAQKNGVKFELKDEIKFELKEGFSDLFSSLAPNDGTIVIYPLFTAAAYQEPGFYTFFRGECDETCITDLSFENPPMKFSSSIASTQILYALGYDFITDIDVDKNPEILKNYDTVILLHNEYVTKKMFDAISSHPHLIFLFPNALYAEIDVNHNDHTMTLIRGHNYPEPELGNGFDYEIEERFHDYEYDIDCLNWKFIQFENGFHLNCYPDSILFTNLEILLAMKEL